VVDEQDIGGWVETDGDVEWDIDGVVERDSDAAPVTVTLTKVAMAFTGKAMLMNEGFVTSKDTLAFTGKDLGFDHSPILTKVALALTGKTTWINEAPKLVKDTLAFTGKALADAVIHYVTFVKDTLAFTGKDLTCDHGVTLVKGTIVFTGKLFHVLKFGLSRGLKRLGLSRRM